ncbi:unnamed protein product [Eretmochelys imbricata]
MILSLSFPQRPLCSEDLPSRKGQPSSHDQGQKKRRYQRCCQNGAYLGQTCEWGNSNQGCDHCVKQEDVMCKINHSNWETGGSHNNLKEKSQDTYSCCQRKEEIIGQVMLCSGYQQEL